MNILVQLAQCFALAGVGTAGFAIAIYYLLHTPGTVSDTHEEPDEIV